MVHYNESLFFSSNIPRIYNNNNNNLYIERVNIEFSLNKTKHNNVQIRIVYLESNYVARMVFCARHTHTHTRV